MSACRSCGNALEVVVDFGQQPPSNRFLSRRDEPTPLHALTLGRCSGCALLQLINPMPTEMVRPRLKWITYTEPQGHLPDLVSKLIGITGLNPQSSVLGVYGNNDRPALRLLATLGIERVSELSLSVSGDGFAGMETWQAHIAPDLIPERERHRHDLVICRYLLEHARNPAQFLQGLFAMAKEDGYVLIEVPDCSKFVEACDYPFIWEEHISYFTPVTLQGLMLAHGLSLVGTYRFEGALEDALAILIQRNGGASPRTDNAAHLRADLRRSDIFRLAHERTTAAYRDHARSWSKHRSTVALLGAGHLSIKFLNMNELGLSIDFVVDDNPDKAGLFTPGSRLPILPTQALYDRNVDVCLLAVNPSSEPAVIGRYANLADRGTRFCSIFRRSAIALLPYRSNEA
jgi:hypothetical protein